jgi:predicted membrane channel-forming protein YqfA (hemolysin III family)
MLKRNPAVAKRKAASLILSLLAINIGVLSVLVFLYKEYPLLDAFWFGMDSLWKIGLIGTVMYLFDDKTLNKLMFLPLGYEIIRMGHDIYFSLTGIDNILYWCIGLVIYFLGLLIWLARTL